VTQVINWPGVGASLQRALGLKGSVKPTIDEVLAGTLQLQDVERGPWAASRSVGIEAVQGGIAGSLAQIIIRPGRGTVLRVDHVEVTNENGGGVLMRLLVGLTAPADYNTFALGAVTPLANLHQPFVRDAATNAVVAANLTPATFAAFLGTFIGQYIIQPDDSRDISFAPNGVFLDGDILDATGDPGALIFAASQENRQIRTSVFGREYFHRG